MMEKNGKKMGWAFFAITMLIGMAMLGSIIPAEADGIEIPSRDVSLIDTVSSSPYYVENGGYDNINVTIALNILESEIDHDNSSINFYHAETGETLVGEFPDPISVEENMTTNTSRFVFDIGVPMDSPVGEYNLTFVLFNLTGANETYDMTKLQINWSERAPMMNNGTVYIHEDDTVSVDLDDHFMDYNMQELMYYINFSAIENLTVGWADGSDSMITITPAENFNGEQTFELNVTDGVTNMTFTMTIMVEAVDDPLMAADDLMIMINEVDMEAEFNALDLFYDPDGPVDFDVSLGTEMVNVSGNMTEMPAYTWTDGNFSVEINMTDNSGVAMILEDLESGMAMFPIYAWIDGNVSVMDNATVKIEEVNDAPVLGIAGIDIIWNKVYSGNLSTLFMDAEGDELNFTVNSTMANNVTIVYDWETFSITITPEVNWTGDSEFEVNVTDGMDYVVVMIPINVMLEKFTVSGVVSFAAVDNVTVDFDNVTLTIGTTVVDLDENGTYSIELDEGNYTMSLAVLPATLLYNEAAMQSGYEVVAMGNLILAADKTMDLSFIWKVYESPVEMAMWSDLDFEKVKFEEDDDIVVIVPVKNGSEEKEGFDSLVVKLLIKESDDDEFNFTLVWDAEDMQFEYTLTEDDLDDLGEGKKEYYFMDETGNETTSVEKYEFKSEDDGAGTMTIIILVALIVLVLIALIFIMKKPSDEDFDEDEEDEDEEEGRTCPGCGEAVTDDEAEECPYCGEDLEEE